MQVTPMQLHGTGFSPPVSSKRAEATDSRSLVPPIKIPRLIDLGGVSRRREKEPRWPESIPRIRRRHEITVRS